MLVSEFIQRVNDAFRGDEAAPVESTDEHDYWLRTGNRKKDEWARDPKQTWASNFEVRELGTITAGTQTYELDEDFLQPSDKITVTDAAGRDHNYVLGPPQERGRYARSAYISGRDPRNLTFFDDIVAGAQIVGGTLKVPGFYIPDDMDNAAGEVPVDDPNWLVLATASELAFNDITYEDKYPDLNSKANALYLQMVTANRKGTSGYPRTARVVGVRINNRSVGGW